MNNTLLSERFKAARMASGLSQEAAAEAANISRSTYVLREMYPGDFRISELKALHSAFNKTGKELLATVIQELFFC